jgi:hypothetical protein
MKFDSSSAKFDSPLARFDQPDPVETRKAKMSKISKALRNGTVQEKIDGTESIATGCAGGNPVGTALADPLADLVAKKVALDTANKALTAAQAVVALKLVAKNTAEQEWNLEFDTFVPLAQTATGGDPEKIRSINMVPYEPGGAPSVGPLTAVLNLQASMGDFPGTVDVQWDPLKGAKTYFIQCTLTPETEASWQACGVSSKSSFTVAGLESGKKYFFRVAAFGAAGQGPWSTVENQMAP